MTDKRAATYLILGGCMWGIYWMPLLYLESLGITGSIAGILLYTCCLVFLAPAIWRYRHMMISYWRPLLLSGALAGSAFSFYTTSLFHTDVIRCILLFYLTPVWGTLIGIFVLGERLTLSRIAVILVAFGGLYVILGADGGLPIPRNLGDGLALLSGVLWALGTLGLMRTKAVPVYPQIIAFLAGSLIVALLTLLLIDDLPIISAAQLDWPLIMGFLGLFAIYALPMFWLTIAPARVLSPARVGILLMSEVVVGAISAALLSGQPFGMNELIGTVLIITAAFIEVQSHRGMQAKEQT